MRRTDERELLETFLAVAGYGNLRLAGKSLLVSKTTVMRRLQELEGRLGAALVERSDAGCALTSRGQIFLAAARPVFERYVRISTKKERPPEQTAVLNVSAPYSLGVTLLIPWLEQFQEAHENVLVDLSLTLGPVRLLPASCDVRFSHGKIPSERVTIRPLGLMPRIMAASPRYLTKHGIPQEPKELSAHRLLGSQDLVDDTSFVLRKDDELIRIPFRPTLLLKDHTAAKEAALAGAGIAVQVLKHDAVKALKRGDLIEVLPDWKPEPCPISLLFPLSRKPSDMTRQFADFIEDKWASHPCLLPAQIPERAGFDL